MFLYYDIFAPWINNEIATWATMGGPFGCKKSLVCAYKIFSSHMGHDGWTMWLLESLVCAYNIFSSHMGHDGWTIWLLKNVARAQDF